MKRLRVTFDEWVACQGKRRLLFGASPSSEQFFMGLGDRQRDRVGGSVGSSLLAFQGSFLSWGWLENAAHLPMFFVEPQQHHRQHVAKRECPFFAPAFRPRLRPNTQRRAALRQKSVVLNQRRTPMTMTSTAWLEIGAP